jgi:hypothetical protein
MLERSGVSSPAGNIMDRAVQIKRRERPSSGRFCNLETGKLETPDIMLAKQIERPHAAL